MKKLASLLFTVSFLFLISCLRVDPKINPPLPTNNLSQIVPENWPQPVYSFENNSISEDKFILGRELFYETLLSKNNTISCGSCHQQFVAFANADHAFSHGINNLTGTRNSPGLFNLSWHSTFMHDGGINHIEVQPLSPIQNPVEMGEEINQVLLKLKNSAKYRQLFTRAFGSDSITTSAMFKSIAQFMGLMLSAESKYDKVKRGEQVFNEVEKKGYDTFVSKCSTCHVEPLMSDFAFRNNGLEVNAKYQDSGRARITKRMEDLYRFKTPSLRNISVTGPYMHDGRFVTLEQCLNHYSDGIKNFVNIDPSLAQGIALSAEEKKNIIIFLNTLTDYDFLGDKRFSNPNNR